MNFFESKYGYFDEEGNYNINNMNLPMPWTHILTNGKYGSVYSHAGSGYSFYIDASQSCINRWVQDLIKDEYGKYVYIRNNDTGEIFSTTYQPVQATGKYGVKYGPGYVRFDTEFKDFKVSSKSFIPLEDDLEINIVEIENKTDKKLNLTLFTYFELNMGTMGDIHREFHKLFFNTKFDDENEILISEKYLWANGMKHWNISYDKILFHKVSKKITGYDTDKRVFYGNYSQIPLGVKTNTMHNSDGRNPDGINSLRFDICLEAKKSDKLIIITGVSEEESDIPYKTEKYSDIEYCEMKATETEAYWKNKFNGFSINCEDKAMQFMLNFWLPYQALAGRLLARTGYYQFGGAYGFRDQLQDSLSALIYDPEITRNQILLHAAHQRNDGSALHWWLPLTGMSPAERWSDDLLWLPFSVCEYIKNTGDHEILKEIVKFTDESESSLQDHCLLAIKNALSNLSERNIPLILDGDWNDGMNGVGSGRKGESFWLSEFLYLVMQNVLEFFVLEKDDMDLLKSNSEKIKNAFNDTAWNGDWFSRAINDNGLEIGSKSDDRIFLNAQNWAVISDICDSDRKIKAMNEVKNKLITDYGPLLFTPPFTVPDESIGYLTRYAPGSRENGGVYTHAAVWTMWSANLMDDSALCDRVYETISPVLRSIKSPDVYSAEPYVMPGNGDGPLTKKPGKAGWTWYTGSAGWYYRSIIMYLLGIQLDGNKIRINPCTEKNWESSEINMNKKNISVKIVVENPNKKPLKDINKIIIDGEEKDSNEFELTDGNHVITLKY